jgi:hypothetical protein
VLDFGCGIEAGGSGDLFEQRRMVSRPFSMPIEGAEFARATPHFNRTIAEASGNR